tara:strand:- start:42 stop:332 length:291 start_codon:yes stop_codon:yes gene_type:complete
MNYDHEAICDTYPDAQIEIVDGIGIFKANTNQKEVFEIDQSLVDATRVELNKLLYKQQRRAEYPDWNTQLDYIYHNGIDKWKTDIVDPVKTKYPKP